jgi:uncharacterized protein YuzE
MKLEYDPEGDTAYVTVSRPVGDGDVHHTEDVSRTPYYTRGVDLDASGSILGYDFTAVSQGLDLAGLPHQDELAALFTKLERSLARRAS